MDKIIDQGDTKVQPRSIKRNFQPLARYFAIKKLSPSPPAPFDNKH
jgi:hypothetical protein